VGYKPPKAIKQVAQSLRLDLAAYRELQSFARTRTTLDAASQDQLERGKRWSTAHPAAVQAHEP